MTPSPTPPIDPAAPAGQDQPQELPDLVTTDVVDLTQLLCDIPSVSGSEAPLADAVEAALGRYAHLHVLRSGNTVLARTELGRAERVVVAGHLDTVPIAANLPTRRERGSGGAEVLRGRGTVDMKGGVAVALHLAAALTEPVRDVTWVFYDNEEVAADLNGLNRVVSEHPDWLAADFAVLGEPTAAGIEAGCNGSLHVQVRTRGRAAHSARAWMGHNAIHEAAQVLTRLASYEPEHVEVDGLTYVEGLNAVAITGGIAGNVIPDECTVAVNYRFAPARTQAEALAHVREVFDGLEVDPTDSSPGARPGLSQPVAAEFVAAVTAQTGGSVRAKQGWTDVARFTALGVPAVNFGPGDPLLAHADDEAVPTEQIRVCTRALRSWLSYTGTT
ncbi:succinyl-diaminopimelate desuccinylase [Pseudactinotalea sp. Z1739]|uniref:succinyl-diaminopimelate desuccinylase n=1 Tax=Pseudactinotalea sp. Z1739 TaxID=3413028 RepID=UPI003C79AD5A